MQTATAAREDGAAPRLTLALRGQTILEEITEGVPLEMSGESPASPLPVAV